MDPRFIDLTGRRFGRLTVVSLAADERNKRWLCRCDCGREKVIQGGNLGRGSTSCGCAHSEELTRRQTRHGACRTPEYRTWTNMKHRCSSPGCLMFYRYGGRGISVCDRWAASFEAFIEDMGPRPSPAHSIDRIDVDGNYEPTNCRWATRSEQMANTSRNRYVEVDGELLIQSEAAKRLGLSIGGLRYRVHKATLARAA